MRRGPADAATDRGSAGARPAATREPRSRSMKNLRRRVARRFELRGGWRGVVHDHAPARRRAQVDVGRQDRWTGAWVAFDGEILVHAVHRDHHAGNGHLEADLHPRAGPAGKDLGPAAAHLVLPGEARAGRMDADDVLVLGPHRHHAVEVAALERLVEGVLGVLCSRKDLAAHKARTSASTRSTDMSFMQRKCPSGHTRAWQGLQSRCSHTTRAAGEAGGVCSGFDEPKRATCGRPSAAAMCIRPESLLTTNAAPAMRWRASSSVVLPMRLFPGMPPPDSRSLPEPRRTTSMPRHCASSLKYGQRLAGPYSAPGHSTA